MVRIMGRIKVGVIGLGNRGQSLIQDVMLHLDNIEITAICDLYKDRVEKMKTVIENHYGHAILGLLKDDELIKHQEIEAVIIASSWKSHIPLTIECMEAQKYVACEVGGASNLDECFELVRVYEKTKTPCMLLENCCYGRDEMLLLNMVKQGIFGTVIHCAGGYQHDLREEVAFGKENRHYRLNHYIHSNCDNYPTHELGPIAKLLNINRGNRLISLSSISSKSEGLHEYIKQHKRDDQQLIQQKFNQGDIVTTSIRCQNGETIVITLDTTLPRPYSRGLRVQGTKAMYLEDNHSIFIDGKDNIHDFTWQKQWGNVNEYYPQYEHPLWRKFLNNGVKGGHGGMDYLVLSAFFECIENHQPMPIDVYDMATLMSISVLSEQSITQGGSVVSIPDFTHGLWQEREDEGNHEYVLSKIIDEEG